jgi:hypothetical protein
MKYLCSLSTLLGVLIAIIVLFWLDSNYPKPADAEICKVVPYSTGWGDWDSGNCPGVHSTEVCDFIRRRVIETEPQDCESGQGSVDLWDCCATPNCTKVREEHNSCSQGVSIHWIEYMILPFKDPCDYPEEWCQNEDEDCDEYCFDGCGSDSEWIAKNDWDNYQPCP